MKNMSLFSQILQLIPRSVFNELVKTHKTEYRSKGFSSWDQFVSMLFCQFAQASSLREITYGLQSCEGKLSHLNIKPPKRSTLSYANNGRTWLLYKDLFESLLQTVKLQASNGKRKFSFSNKLYSIDSSTIDLCLSVFDWAKYRSKKGAIKLHMRLDHDGYIPDFLHVTEGRQNDVKAAWQFPFEAGSISVFDRGYNDYKLYEHIDSQGAFFVTRMKAGTRTTVLSTVEFDDPDLISDSTVTLHGDSYSNELRMISAIDVEGRKIEFLTNNFDLDAETISAIYRERWKIELFFKEIKQNLKIKTFIGTSENAVMTQIYTALITILMLKYIKLKSSFNWSMSNLATLIRMNLFTHKDLWKWINAPFITPPEEISSVEQQVLQL
jgi:hypothetical protein